MRMNKNYAITPDTLMIVPHYNNGQLHSLVCGKDGYLEADKSPYQLIDTNFLYRGTSLRGAMEGAHDILGKISMYPIILDYEKEIILLPCKSPARKDCIWFSLSHIHATDNLQDKHTLVTLSNGSTIDIDISKEIFDKKMRKAYELQFKMAVRRKLEELDELASETPYHLFKMVNGVNYEERTMTNLSFTAKLDYKKPAAKK